MPDPLDTLSTCWYCPVCYSVPSASTGGPYDVCDCDYDTTNADARQQIRKRWVEVPIVPPAASSEQRHTILRLLGYEIIEGWGDKAPVLDHGYLDVIVTRAKMDPEHYVPVLVLRDQRETTK